jgi:hypothetical protein
VVDFYTHSKAPALFLVQIKAALMLYKKRCWGKIKETSDRVYQYLADHPYLMEGNVILGGGLLN